MTSKMLCLLGVITIMACSAKNIFSGPWKPDILIAKEITFEKGKMIELLGIDLERLNRTSHSKILDCTIAFYDKVLSNGDPDKSIVWKKIIERYIQIKKVHTGKIEMFVQYQNGETDSIFCSGFHGDFGMEGSIPIGKINFRNSPVKRLAISIVETDSLLTANMNHPFIWIYSGGGK